MKFLIKWYDFNYSLTEFFLLIDILKQHTTSIELKQFAVKIMEESGSFDYTKHYLSKTEKKARDEVQILGGNPMLEQLMDFLSVQD